MLLFMYLALTIYLVSLAWKAGWKWESVAIAVGTPVAQFVTGVILGTMVGMGIMDLDRAQGAVPFLTALSIVISWTWLRRLAKNPKPIELTAELLVK